MKFEDLTPKMIEKTERCQTAEERMAFIAEHGIELTDQQLEGIAGGKSKKTRSTGYCPKSSDGKHNYVLTGRKKPGKYFGDLWPDVEKRCRYCDDLIWDSM